MTERKSKHAGLNERSTEYQVLFERAPCYISVQDTNLRLLRFNREFEKKFSPEIGDYCYKVYKGRSRRCEECPVIKTFEDGMPHSSEETGFGKDGQRSYWLARTAPIRNSRGEIIAAIEMSVDLTEVKLLQKEVERSEAKYQIIFNSIPNPVFVIDGRTLKIVDCNSSVGDVYGFSPSELIGTSFIELFEDDERDLYSRRIKNLERFNQARHVRKDGKTIYVNIRNASSEYEGRKVILVTTNDITKRLLAEQQLIQASKMSTLGEMATGVAHELNQPLSVIKTASSFLKRKVQNGEVVKEHILDALSDEIDSHVDRAAKIINHMREFGRKSDVKAETVCLNEPLLKALEIFNQQFKLREIEVVTQLEDDLTPVMADPNRLEQVFVNLLINARDSIEAAWISGSAKAGGKRIYARSSSSKDSVTVELQDTGTGIPPAVLGRVFEPFFTTKPVGKGTGIGLSISYGIIQDYNGTIRVDTKEGEGSTFIINFPAKMKQNHDTQDPTGR